jgi:hypothetical protein
MAATALSRLATLTLVLAGTLPGQDSKGIDRQLSHVATALTAGNPSDAITPFDKSFDGYTQLSDDFVALTNSYRIVNEIEIADEQIEDGEATLTVHWVMTLSDLENRNSEVRTEEVTVKLTLKKNEWRIVAFSPLDLFNPELRRSK